MKNWTGNYRARNHDYASRCIYHVTMVKANGVGSFGRLAGDLRVPVGTAGAPYVIASPIGAAIKNALRMLPSLHPAIRVYQYALMPDHLHVVIAVEGQMDEPLGRKLARFKRKAAEYAGVDCVFEPGFNDRIMYKSRSLDTVFRYLRENPYRLAVRHANPDFFRRVSQLKIGDVSCRAYGNMQLLQNPFKEQVVVHRADGEEKRRTDRDRWLHSAANGGVLVSPFISPAEKAVRTDAEALGAKIILITAEPMDDRYKPAATNFALCTQGRMLIITPVNQPFAGILSRNLCLSMNALAADICKD